MQLHMEAAKRLKCGRQPADRSAQTCGRHHAATALNRWLLSWLPTIQHRQQRRRHALVRRRRGSGATSQRGSPTTATSASVPADRCVFAERSQQQRQLRRRGRAAIQGVRAHRERPVQLNSRVDGRAAPAAQRAPPRELREVSLRAAQAALQSPVGPGVAQDMLVADVLVDQRVDPRLASLR